MDNFVVEILDPQEYFLQLETSFGDRVNNLEIERSNNSIIEIINTSKVLVSDLPDIPFDKILGNLSVARIDGLDDYLDNYEFDCGSP